MNRKDFIYRAGMAGMSLPFLNATGAAAQTTKAKSVINIFLNGGLSQYDSFNVEVDKPVLGKSTIIKSNVDGVRVSNYYPKLAKQMDQLLVLNAMKTNQGAHPAGIYKMLTSYNPRSTVTHPELGAWVNKCLTTERDSLPNFVSIGSGRAGSAGFFPGQWAALPVKNPDKGIDFVKRSESVGEKAFKNRLNILDSLNKDFAKDFGSKDTRSYVDTYAGSLKFMNSNDIDAFELKNENSNIVNLYDKSDFSRSCLLAGRLVERGVRFVKVNLGGWDYHDGIYEKMPANANKLDSGLSSLLTHLSQKGLLESTLMVVSTEFGRKPEVNPNRGRDHHPDGFTCLMAGAGVKAGQIYGSTSKDGKHADQDVLDVTDFNATIAWRLGIDPDFEENSASGRPFKLANKGKARKELFG
ncbi:MAG: DUF1501 domain-containing protein [Verrucomicrobiales bacterium]|jgi:hypothetical protein|nr:DUF1501 domain-containing protein [Verrucomicrobiales bacterium]MDB4789594.1 DUF1501 domain-containing protein [Verrucomicrobiales bacterium]